MIDLSAVAGIEVALHDTHLIFGAPMSEMVESVRQVNSLSAVWMDSSVHGEQDIYRVYWGAYRAVDTPVFAQHGLDHAYVVLFPGRHACEYNKTQGHYHPPLPGTTTSTPELYKVLYGQGYFALQRSHPPYDAIDDVVLVEAQAGDVFHVAPNYGHLTINTGDVPLVFEAFLPTQLTPLTEPYRARRGGAHYVVVGPDGQPEVISNALYGALPHLRHCRAAEFDQWESTWGRLCYAQVVEHPEAFHYLVDPAGFEPAWTL